MTIRAVCGICVLLLASATAFAKVERPNVLLIYSDDQGSLDANCYGSEDLITPNMDRLAATGVRFMSLNASKSRLSALTKDLNAKWRSTRESWRDQRALEFEKQYMDELLSSVSTALNQIDKLEQTLNHIRRDCE